METDGYERIRQRLTLVYGAAAAPEIGAAIELLVNSYQGRIQPLRQGWSEQDALLITYADAILGDAVPPLPTLESFLAGAVGDLLPFVHLLPFYPYSSDDGFAVEDFRQVRPDLGSWADIRRMSATRRLVFDGVINHVSASSGYMKGYCAGDPAWADFFIALDPGTDTSKVLRTRNLPLLHDYETAAGRKWLWTTFSRDQADLNFANPQVLLEVLDVLLFYAEQGAAMIRLDAIPYLWKELGTSCAHLPQTHELIKLIRDVYDIAAPHVLLLTETNVPHQENIRYFGDRGDEAQMIYNFSLAPLILWSLIKGNAAVLSEWAGGIRHIGPRATYLNITATHDGIGMRPTEGILSEAERRELVQLATDHHGDVTGKRNADGTLSPYELNLNYFDAVNHPDSREPIAIQVQRFLVSQAITMAMIGLPGIYLHSLLGSRNDLTGVKRTGRARSINRRQLPLAELQRELADPGSLRSLVFRSMKQLLQVRAGEPAFHPDALQDVLSLGPDLFALRRFRPETGAEIVALHNVTAHGVAVAVGKLAAGPCRYRDLLTGAEFAADATIALAPYQVGWLKRL